MSRYAPCGNIHDPVDGGPDDRQDAAIDVVEGLIAVWVAVLICALKANLEIFQKGIPGK